MRMILVHGINQQEKSSQLILDTWLPCLRATYAKLGVEPLGKLSRIEAAFYGNTLHELSTEQVDDQAIALGSGDVTDDFADFSAHAFRGMAKVMGATDQQISAQLNTVAVAEGAGINKELLKAIARVVQTISPWGGTLALRMLGQAHAYIRNQYVHDRVNDDVRELFVDDEPAIVISHSLGTLVAYSMLREFAKNNKPRNCPLFVTLGSPLGIDSVRMGFQPPRTTPNHVMRWVNGADPEDFVALQTELNELSFGPAHVINYSDIDNGYEDPHSICGYLSDRRIADEISKAIQ